MHRVRMYLHQPRERSTKLQELDARAVLYPQPARDLQVYPGGPRPKGLP
jgi:hypothetical protein